MEPWEIMISESQERMVAVVAPADARRGARGVRALGAAVHRDRRGDRHAASCTCFHEGEIVGEIPARFLTDECPRYEVEQRAARPSAASRRRRSAQALLELLARRTSQPRAGSTSGTTTSSARAPCAAPGSTRAVLRLRPSLRGLAVSLDGAGPDRAARPAHGGALAVFEAARNVACAGGEPLGAHGLPQLRQPGEAGDRVGARARRSRASRAAATALGIPVVSGQRLALQRDRRPCRSARRRSSAASGSCRTCAQIPDRWREGDVVLLARASGRRARSAGGGGLVDSCGASRRCCRSRTTSSDGGLERRAARRRRSGAARRRDRLAGRRGRGDRVRAGRGRSARRRGAAEVGMVGGDAARLQARRAREGWR